MTATVLVTGGTGTLGRLVVPQLRAAGVAVRILSRSPHSGDEYVVGDLATGAGIEAAVAGVDTILHLAGDAKGDDDKARTLVNAALATGNRPHIVYISVVGADRESFAYFAYKHRAEQIIANSGLPWTTVRATQFHSLLLTVVQSLTKLPVVPVFKGFRFQPVDPADVATRLVELALSEPAGLVPDIAGPDVYTFDQLVTTYLATTHRRRPTLKLSLPGKAARAFRTGPNLTSAEPTGTHTWEAFIAAQSQSSSGSMVG